MAEVQVADPTSTSTSTSDGTSNISTSNTSTSTRSNNNTMASRSLLEEQHKDVTEQLNALTDAIRLLTRSMSSTHTQQPETTNRNTQLQMQMQPEVALALDQLLQRWKLEQTGFPTLYNACTQLKESLHLTATEADQAIHDIHASRQALAEEKRLGCKMKKVLQRLCKENRDVRKQNARLGLEVKRCKAEKKMIVNSVRDYMTSTARTRSSTRGSTHTNSCEHAVEDGDGLELEHKEERGIDTSAETSFGGSESSEAEAETVSVPGPVPGPVPVPPSPTSSCKSFVTDEGCATLFLSKKQRSIFSIFKNKSVRTAASASSSSSSSSSKIQDIRFTNQSPGLQFLRVPQAQKGSSEEDADADADSNNNSIRAPLFLVCGYMGFQDSQHRRPTFGSRLISIDSHSLDREVWSAEDLAAYTNTNTVKKKNVWMKMRFRNDPISDENMKKLKARSHELSNL